MNAFHITAVNPDGTYQPKGEVRIQATIAALLMATLASLFFYTARLVLPLRWSVLIALSAAFGTQVWSTASRGLWSHDWQLTLVGIVIWMLLAQETGRRKWNPVVLGTLLAWIYFGFDPEVTAKIARLDLRIMEVPISYFPRKYLEGKKMNWKDGIVQLAHIIRFNLWKGRADCFNKTLPEHYRPDKDHWL
jgi:hypothetical protein